MPKFDIIDPGWSYSHRDTFSPAVRKGNWLFISGLDRHRRRGNIVGKGDIVAQTHQIFAKIQAILDAAGGSFDDIVKTIGYIVTTEGYKSTADVRREYFRNGFPAATGIVVQELLRPDTLIEIDAIAVLEDKIGDTIDQVRVKSSSIWPLGSRK
jgi:enamine deaminase RidA (YjgF/YER057c/UK114 family)